MRVIKKFLKSRPTCNIYHYTDAAAAIGILSKRVLWATHIRHLNDSSEFNKAGDWISEELKRRDGSGAARALLSVIDREQGKVPLIQPGQLGRTAFSLAQESKPVFVVSFSESENILSQWRAYCPEGNGYSIGFDASDFVPSNSGTTRLVKCVYTKDDREDLCQALIDSWADQDVFDSANLVNLVRDCSTIMAAIKDESFEEEQEWRLVLTVGDQPLQFRRGRHGVLPYLEATYGTEGELQLKSIWLGPNSDLSAASFALRMLTKASEAGEPDIKQSGIPYRW